MILQSTLSPSMPNSLSSSIPHPLSYPSGCHFFTPLSKFRTSNHSVKCSSLSHVYNSYGSVHNQMWNHIYGRLSFEDPELEVASVLNQIEQEGKELTKCDLCTVAKELRKYRQFRLALEGSGAPFLKSRITFCLWLRIWQHLLCDSSKILLVVLSEDLRSAFALVYRIGCL